MNRPAVKMSGSKFCPRSPSGPRAALWQQLGTSFFKALENGGVYAFNAETGEQLFQYKAPRTVQSSPLTYEINDTQYVTVIATNTILTFALP